MKLSDKNKETIDNMSYEELFRKMRFTPCGDPWFQGETGDYWFKRMKELELDGADRVATSKRLGWEQ